MQTLHAKTGGHPLKALDRLKSMRLPAMGMAAKSIKPGASPLQRIGQPGQVRIAYSLLVCRSAASTLRT